MVRIEEPGNIVRSMLYSPEGDIVSYDDRTRRMKYGYCGYHEVAWREEAGTHVQYRYSAEDDLLELIDEAGEVHRFERDACRYIIEEKGFDGRKRNYIRNANGWITTHFLPSEEVEKYEYDAIGRTTRVSYPDGTTAAFSYDGMGRLRAATNANGTVRFDHDPASRTVVERFGDHWVASKLDSSSERIEVTSSLGLAERIARSAMGEVTEIDFWKRGTEDRMRPAWSMVFERDAVGREVARRMPGGVTIPSCKHRWRSCHHSMF